MRFFSCMSVFLGLAMIAAGCGNPASERLNAPPQGTTDNPSVLQAPFVYMVDNAMLEDLSLASIHFVPHSAELNGLGARRLERYAKLLAVYGGGIRYTSGQGQEKLTEPRLASIRSYLATTSIASDRIKVTEDIPGGVGISAKEAIAAKAANLPAGGAGQASGGGGGPLSALSGLFGGGK